MEIRVVHRGKENREEDMRGEGVEQERMSLACTARHRNPIITASQLHSAIIIEHIIEDHMFEAYCIGFLSGCGAASNCVNAGVQSEPKRM